MMKDNELFQLVKTDPLLYPEKSFILSTEMKLRKIARKTDRKQKYKTLPVLATTIALFIMGISWIFLLGGNQTINSASFNNGLSILNPDEPLVFIYHTHNRESFKQELNVEDEKSFDEFNNISLVGKRLTDSLKNNSIGTLHDTTDIFGSLKDKGISETNAFLESREIVKNAQIEHKNIKMFIDIHRDTVPRNESTIELNGDSYAKVAFIISNNNENNKDNINLSKALHNTINQRFPGMSRGIIMKDSEQRSANYNQDLTNSSILISIGGIENTLEEEYRTADILAEAIKEIIQQMH